MAQREDYNFASMRLKSNLGLVASLGLLVGSAMRAPVRCFKRALVPAVGCFRSRQAVGQEPGGALGSLLRWLRRGLGRSVVVGLPRYQPLMRVDQPAAARRPRRLGSIGREPVGQRPTELRRPLLPHGPWAMCHVVRCCERAPAAPAAPARRPKPPATATRERAKRQSQ